MHGEKSQTLCILCPCYNEAEVLPLFYRELEAALEKIPGIDHTIIFLDDGSTDSTLETLNSFARENPRVQVYSFSRNFGHQAALSAGLERARADATVLMDSDLQHPPALISKMVELWRKGHDVVLAVREKTEDASFWKRTISGGFYRLFNILSDTRIVTGAADFCLLSRRAREAILRMPEHHRFLRGMIAWIGFPRATVPYVAPPRPSGKSKYTFPRMLRLALDAIFSFSTRPLRLATFVGLSVSALGALYLAYAVAVALFSREAVKGWSSILCSILILGGAQILFLGIIGEYLGRVLEEVKARPLYLFRQIPPGEESAEETRDLIYAGRGEADPEGPERG